MDSDSRKDELSVESGNLVIFTDITCNTKPSYLGRCRKRKPELISKKPQLILKGACGALRPGRLTFILGPSGAGKTTLMKILAGRKKSGVTGYLQGTDREVVLVSQHATLLDTLTGKETLLFAAQLKLPNISLKDRLHLIQDVCQQLGITDVLNTRNNCMSGGERKRLSTACELLTDPTILLLDEPTSGLDSVSSLSVAKALHSIARGGRTVACVIHQPSSKLYSIADDIILLADGITLYAGSVDEAPEVMKRAGFVCPQFYNMAEYLLEVASHEHSGDLNFMKNEARSYASEMKKMAVSEQNVPTRKVSISAIEAEALLSRNDVDRPTYATTFCQQLRALLWRCAVGTVRDVHLTQIRIVCHIVVGLLLGVLYSGAGAEAGRVTSNTACLFFFLLFIFFSNSMPTINTFPAEANVVIQEHLNKWYSLPSYCLSKILADLPTQIICATVFMLPAWMLTSQPLEFHRMSLAWCICVLVTILAQTFGLVIGAACDVKLGLFVLPAANIPMLMFSEFFIPYKEMPSYLQPLATISYFRYAFDAFIQTVYGFDREKLPCNDVFCFFKYPAHYLKHLGLNTAFEIDICVLLAWIFLLQILFLAVLHFKVLMSCR